MKVRPVVRQLFEFEYTGLEKPQSSEARDFTEDEMMVNPQTST